MVRIYQIKSKADRFLCVDEETHRYRAVWLNTKGAAFKLDSLINPRSLWLPTVNGALARNLADYELVEEGLTLREAYEHLSMLQLMEM